MSRFLIPILILTSNCFVDVINGEPYVPGTFGQITDIHWDTEYSRDGDKGKMCRQDNELETASRLGPFGDYNCDAPALLVKAGIEALGELQDKPEFILWTGDMAPHVDKSKLSFEYIFDVAANVTLELKKIFQNSSAVLPVLGNHDAYPQDQYLDCPAYFYRRYLEEAKWEELLTEEQQETFARGGFYEYTSPSNLKVLVVNTNLYYIDNTMIDPVRHKDPCGQFVWLQDKLETARKEEQKILITSHAPAGFFERAIGIPFLQKAFNERFVNLLSEYSDVIHSQIYGHLHTDTFRLHSGTQDDIGSVCFIAPSLTPWRPKTIPGGTAINPSLRYYSYDENSVQNYLQYHFNLTEANEEGAPEWVLYYNATQEFDLPSLDYSNMWNLWERLGKDDDLLQKLYSIDSAGYNDGLCDEKCKKHQICAIRHLHLADAVKCVWNSYSEFSEDASKIYGERSMLNYTKNIEWVYKIHDLFDL